MLQLNVLTYCGFNFMTYLQKIEVIRFHLDLTESKKNRKLPISVITAGLIQIVTN